MDQSQEQPGEVAAATLAAEPLRPVAQTERLVSLDIIRGFAVLGILIANIGVFGQPDFASWYPPALPGGAYLSDKLVWLAQLVFVDGKLRGLFTMLFGAGLVLFIERREDHSRGTRLQLRRLAWLALFGLAHFFLLFRGDILFSYAVAGAVALLFLHLNGERLLAIGLIWAVVGGAVQMLAYLTPALIEAGGTSTDGEAMQGALTYYRDYWDGLLLEARLQQQLFSGDSYIAILRYVMLAESGLLGSYVSYCFFETIPLMLLGMGLFRLGIFAGSETAPHWRGLAIGGVIAGLALNLASGIHVLRADFPPYQTQLAVFGLTNIFNIPLLLGGMALAAHWAARPPQGWLVDRLALAGRMAFTNYLGTSLVMVLVFQGWAGGLYGQLHRAELLLVVLLGWALMITGSRLWLGRFRYGPLEWVWRCLTYWRFFPNRLPRE